MEVLGSGIGIGVAMVQVLVERYTVVRRWEGGGLDHLLDVGNNFNYHVVIIVREVTLGQGTFTISQYVL